MTTPDSQKAEVSEARGKSEDFLEIDLLGIFRAVLKRWKLSAAIIIAVIALGLAYCFTATPVYLASSRMLVEPGSLRVTEIEDVYNSETGRDSVSRRDFINTQMQMIKSDHILARVYEHFKFNERPGFEALAEPLKALANLVDVKQVPNTSLIDIGFKSTDPKFAAEVANFIAEEYIDDSRKRSSGFSELGLERLRAELTNMEANRYKAIAKLNDFKQLHQMLSVETSSQLLISRLTSLETAEVAARQALANAQASVASVEIWKKEGQRLDSIPEAIANPTLANFKVVRLQAQAQLVKSLQDFGPTHRTVSTQRQVIAEMDKAIENETENSLISIQAKANEAKVRLDLISAQRVAATEELMGLDRISHEYKVLEDNLAASEKAYQYVLERVSELEIARSADTGSGGTFQVIVPATPPVRAAFPQKAKTMIILTLAAVVASVLLSIVLELLDRTLKSREEFENETGLPVFGVIPFVKDPGQRGPDFVCIDAPKSETAEAFRSLRTSISLSKAASKAKLLAITSALPHESKSFVSFNLAVTYARSGKRVLFVDADIRRRRMTSLLFGDQKDMPGLSNILAETISISDTASLFQKPFEDLPLTILPSGPIPPNPTELLANAVSREFFERLAEAFDIVIVDTAPVLPVADTQNLAAIEGMRFFVVGRIEQTERAAIRATVDSLQKVGANVVGTVAQLGEKTKSQGGSDYKYNYKYGYRYGYGGHGKA
ncbi:polysaccharide biosynthesis tyrosine autokinase [Sutterella sp.]|uniref:GumC family protein n=1 Tax=Sutterella sp. TaxID=1981025 RepID=UPI0026E06F0A|nr:polysaccharide biosynthesis tyrosine autokinase [Sutterella sp.]MDO5530795.1 polysaccharide biosynthesis tyrosine autokinase [Sutterella sp.]